MRSICWFVVALSTVAMSVSAYGQARGRGEGGRGGERGGSPERRSGGAAPGGNWSQRTHQGSPTAARGTEGDTGRFGAGAGDANPEARRGAQSGSNPDAAAGAAAANRRQPTASGAQGAAAGAAAANRRQPQATGAQGAAAGAAAANRRQPQATGAQGAAVGAAAANRNNPAVSGAAGAAAGFDAAQNRSPSLTGAQGAAIGSAVANSSGSSASGTAAAYAAVRNNYQYHGIYAGDWYANHPNAWAPPAWSGGTAWSAPTNWNAVASYLGSSATPVSYNYGGNVNYQNGAVMVNGQSAGSAGDFSQQALDLAQGPTNPPDSAGGDQWLPLGIFALVRDETQNPHLILQLAVNKQGILRGNYTDEVTDHTLAIQGAVDPQTYRAAWTVGDNKTSVVEAGLSNLVQGVAPALIHKNGKTDHWLLVRLTAPKKSDGDDRTATPAPVGAP